MNDQRILVVSGRNNTYTAALLWGLRRAEEKICSCKNNTVAVELGTDIKDGFTNGFAFNQTVHINFVKFGYASFVLSVGQIVTQTLSVRIWTG